MMTRKTRMIFVEEVTDTEKDSNLFNSFDVDVENVKTDIPKAEKTEKKAKKKATRKKSDQEKKKQELWSEGHVKEENKENGENWKRGEDDDVHAENDEVHHDELTQVEAGSPGERPKSGLSLSIKRLPKLFAASSSKPESFSNAAVSHTNPTPSPHASPSKAVPAAPASTSAAVPRPLFKKLSRGGGVSNRGGATKLKACLNDETNEMKTIEDSLLYQKLRNLFISMMITGIFFVRQQKTSPGSKTRFIRNCSLQQVYCTIILLTLTFNFLRSLTAFNENDFSLFESDFFFKLLTSMFFYEAMSRALMAYVASYRKNGGLRELFLKLENIFYPDDIIPYEESLRRMSNILIALTVLVSLSHVGVTAYGFFGPTEVRELYDNFLSPVPPDIDGILAFKMFLLLLTFVNSMVAILTMSFYAVICYVLYKEFEYFCRTFAMKIRDDGTFTDDLEKFRISHQKRCKVVEHTDQMFKYYIANTYVTNTPMLCLLLYTVVYSEYNESYRFISVFNLCYVLLHMLLVSAAATIISSQAHAPLTCIYGIRVQSSTTAERQLQVNMFLNKLTGTQIGLTAWDMFVVNKPAVLAVLGMILTYFFLLLQFKNPLADTYCSCNIMFNGTNITVRGEKVAGWFY